MRDSVELRLSHSQDSAGRRLVLPALFASNYAIFPSQLVITVLLVEITRSFDLALGVTSQIRSFSLFIAVATTLAAGLLSIWFRKKPLLLAGLLALALSAVGCGLSTGYNALFLSYALTGIGTAIVTPMTTALIGDHFSAGGTAGALGWYGTAGGLSHMIGSQAVGFLALIGGWRLPFLVYALPVSILGLLLVHKGIPRGPDPAVKSHKALSEGYIAVASNRSALACLAAIVLGQAAWQGVYFFSVSFLKDELSLSPLWAAGIYSVMSIMYILGSQLSSKLVAGIGRRTAAITAVSTLVLLTLAYTNIPALPVALVCNVLGCSFGAFLNLSSIGLSLGQVKEARGIMMSLNSAAMTVGGVLGTWLGGWMILYYGWKMLGVSLGALGAAAASIYWILVKERKGDEEINP